MSQTGNFNYHEGDRQAPPELAVYSHWAADPNTPTAVTVLTGQAGRRPI